MVKNLRNPEGFQMCSQGTKLGKRSKLHFLSGNDVQVKYSCNFATVTDVLVARSAMLVTFATVLVKVSSLKLCTGSCDVFVSCT